MDAEIRRLQIERIEKILKKLRSDHDEFLPLDPILSARIAYDIHVYETVLGKYRSEGIAQRTGRSAARAAAARCAARHTAVTQLSPSIPASGGEYARWRSQHANVAGNPIEAAENQGGVADHRRAGRPQTCLHRK